MDSPCRVDMPLCFQVFPQIFRRFGTESRRLSVCADDRNGGKLMRLYDAEADASVVLNLLLEVLGKFFVALRGNNRERVDLKAVQALALLIDAQAQAAPIWSAVARVRCGCRAGCKSERRWDCPNLRAKPSARR